MAGGFVFLMWWAWQSQIETDLIAGRAFEAKRQEVMAWLAEKKNFRALQADPQTWENWLDQGSKLATSLKVTESLNKQQLDELARLHAAVVNDLRVYESARAIVSMQSGAQPPKATDQGASDADNPPSTG